MARAGAAWIDGKGWRVPLDVIGAGFGRTGTNSLQHALERLGFSRCGHMIDLIEQPERFAIWEEALRRTQAGEPVDWDAVFAGYKATVDWPSVFFWRELTDFYPEAKVILSVRDPERWYDSARETIWPVSSAEGEREFGVAFPPEFADLHRRVVDLLEPIVWQGTFGGRFRDRAAAIDVFQRHNAAVQAAISPGRLLVFEAKQGWEPLCRFLDLPVPDEPFPHVNDRDAFKTRREGRRDAQIGGG
jgi:sulfotransferase family protein